MRLLAIALLNGQGLADTLQHAERRLQAMGEVFERVAIALALAPFAVEQAVEGIGQAQQLARVIVAQALARARLHAIEFIAEPAQAAKAPGQAEPQQAEQHQQGDAQPQAQLPGEAVEQHLIFTRRLHGDDAQRRFIAAQQVHLDVVDEVLMATVVTDTREFVALAVIVRQVAHQLVDGRARTPEQRAVPVEDESQQMGIEVVELLVGHLLRHVQLAIVDARGRDQRRRVGGQALLHRLFQGHEENALQHRHQRQHEQHRQGRAGQHQPQAQRAQADAQLAQDAAQSLHLQRSLNM